jgi:hypothetical protein
LQLPEPLAWLALAAVSGIVGAKATKIYDATFNRIIEQIKLRYKESNEILVLDLVEDEDELQKFIRYVTNYPGNIKEVPMDVAKAMIEEMIVHESVRRRGDEPRFTEKTEEEQFDAFRTAMAKVLEEIRYKPDTTNLWRGLSKSKDDS